MTPAAKTPAERQAALKARRAAAGRTRVEVWLHPDDKPRLLQYAARLERARSKVV